MLENLPYFQRHLPDDLAKVNAVINQAVQSDVALISQIGTYIISAGGKRLRPIITILAGKAVGHDDEKLYSLAAMVEFIHTSTLLHDDVVDESDLRRGRKTANNLFGNAAAVLVGDFLYTRAFQLMVAAAQVGAILGKASPEHEQALKDYGMYVGTAFQIIDDVLDYSGETEEIGKNVGDDLAEGKPTLPLIYLMRNGSEQAANDVRHALENADRNYFEKIHDYVVNSDALPYSISEAKKAVDKAIASLNVLPDSEVKEAMIQLAKESLARVS